MQRIRRLVQLSALALVLSAVFVFRGNAEAWCPFGGVEALYTFWIEGSMVCSLGVSNFYILGGVLVSVLLLKRAFCGWLCPIGSLSEWIHAAARRLGVRPVRVLAMLDRVLALLKYVVLGMILWFTWRAGELVFRGYDPCYALIGRHGEDITVWAYVVSGAIVVGSLLLLTPFCRWFCPLAAVLNPFSKLALARVKRESTTCVDCGKCAKLCPAAIPVDRMSQVTESRCVSCLTCMDVCPVNGKSPASTGALRWGPPDAVASQWPRWSVPALLLLSVTGAVVAVRAAPMPSFVKSLGVPPAETARVELRLSNLTCRGTANLLVGFLSRDDLYAIARGEGAYFKLEAWPGPGWAKAVVTYDPAVADAAAVRRAICEPYFDAGTDRWWHSPFEVEGYDPLAIE